MITKISYIFAYFIIFYPHFMVIIDIDINVYQTALWRYIYIFIYLYFLGKKLYQYNTDTDIFRSPTISTNYLFDAYY